MFNVQGDPTSLEEVLSSPTIDFWREVINDEMDSLLSNRTWKLVDMPFSCKTIGCKWVLRRNLKPNGYVDNFEARIVAKGFKQKKKDIDFFDTFSHVIQNLFIHQMYIRTT